MCWNEIGIGWIFWLGLVFGTFLGPVYELGLARAKIVCIQRFYPWVKILYKPVSEPIFEWGFDHCKFNYIQKSNFYFNIKIFASFLHIFQSPKNDVVQFIFWVSIETQELQSKFRVWFWPNTAQMKNVFLLIFNIALP